MTAPAKTVPVVRLASAADAETIGDLAEAAFDPAYGEAWSRTDVPNAFAIPGTWGVIAIDPDGHAVGFALARSVFDESELLLLATAPDHRRRGIGRCLVRSVLEQARVRGTARLYLEVRASNADAVALYRHLQFEDVGARPGYYRGRTGEQFDAITMRILL